MKKLDSICSKLMHQNAVADQFGADNQSGTATNGDQQQPISDIADKQERTSPSIRINKRKNFTPRVFRLCDEQLTTENRKEAAQSAVECFSTLGSNEHEEETPKRRRFSETYKEDRNGSAAGESGDKHSEHARNDLGSRNGKGQSDEDEDVLTPGLLAIVEPEENLGTASGRSSSNRSNSIFASAATASASVSPSLLLGTVTALANVAQCHSPSATASALSTPANNRYVQHRITDPDSRRGVGQSETGASMIGSKSDQQTSPVASYIVRFMGNDCGAEQCRFSTSREHFHCKLCNNKLFTKKEEMLRHYKWHRKREESLAYGFMRYSASDDCSQHFADCVHNLRQTHYHCIHDGCDRVYISTSDVQMHSNSHRKQAHIAKEGFQRVKGSEQCTYAGCPFTDPPNRTTHFHCLRPGCTHSFKNKADMDKHKAHHTRDEQLTRDGFKKYMKSEACSFAGCAFSRIVNHIHCIRPGCDYVLHSTSQMYSHKRKHEKQDKRVSDYVAQQQAIATAFNNAAALMTAAGASASFSSSSSAPSPTSPSASTIGHHVQNDTAGLVPSQFPSIPAPINGSADGSTNAVDRSDQSFSPPVAKKVAAMVQGRLKLKQYDPHARTFHDAGTLGSKPVDDRSSGSKTAAVFPTSTAPTTQTMEFSDSDEAVAIGIDMSTLQSPIQFLKSVTKAETDGETETGAVSQTVASSVAETVYAQSRQQQNINGRNKGDDSWKKFITRYTANDPCVPLCPLLYKDHYHCTAGEGCKMTFKSKDGVRDHAKQHEQLCQAIEHFRTFEAEEDCKVDGCPYLLRELHYHCLWDNCSETIGSSEPVFRRLEHHKVHEYSNQLLSDSRTQNLFASGASASTIASRSSNLDGSSASISPSQSSVLSTSACGEVFKRKRGRPPKYNVLDVNVNPSTHVGRSSEFLLASFKLPKGTSGLPSAAMAGQVQSPQQSQSEHQQNSPSSQSRRGRPRTVSSPRHASEDTATAVNPTAAAAVALLQQQQAHHLQQQLELLRMWNSFESLPAPGASSPANPLISEPLAEQSASVKRPQFDGFTTYTASENCPDNLCRYRAMLHYHCRLPRCFYSSNRGDQLESHHRDFHDAFEIPDGYACYDRSYNCRHTSCQYNGQARHFHCQKAGCSAALLKFNELTAHTSKGHDALPPPEQQFGSPAQNSNSPDADVTSSAIRNAKQGSNHVVRTSGIFYPTTVRSQSAVGGLPPASFPPQSLATSSALSLNPATFAALAQSLSPAFAFINAAAALGVGTGSSVSTLGAAGANGIGGIPSNNPLPYTVEQQCGRPFCKLKRRLHYHCTLCHQGFSHFDRLTVHMQKHGVVLPPLLAQQPPISSTLPTQTAPAALSSIREQQRLPTNAKTPRKTDEDNKLDQPTLDASVVLSSSPTVRAASNQRKIKFHAFEPKMMKFSNVADSGASAEPAAAVGVEVSKATYRGGAPTNISTSEAAVKPPAPKRSKKSTNQGPMAKDFDAAASGAAVFGSSTQFKFVDCTADVTHAIEHQLTNRGLTSSSPALPSANSIQKLLQQQDTSPFACSASPPPKSLDASAKRPLACTDDSCSKRSTSNLHYHCEKCEFWTPESTKWHVHVKQHARMDQVAALGFRKVLAGDANGGGGGDAAKSAVVTTIACPLSFDCSVANQSHYHCVTCNSTALNQSQMSAHKATKHPDVD